MKSLGSEICRVSAACVVLLGLAVSGRTAKVPAQVGSDGVLPVVLQILPRLPYPTGALEPYLSSRTVSFHYEKHQQGYVENLNKLIAGTTFSGLPLEAIVKQTADVPGNIAIFNNAAQAWNHAFFWQSMKQTGGGKPVERLMERIEKSFGTFGKFKEAFTAAAVGLFGSGWVWLVQDGADKVKIVTTANADTPIAHDMNPILACDVWEHAYYLDYQNRREDFVQAYLDHLVNWDFALSQLKPWPE